MKSAAERRPSTALRWPGLSRASLRCKNRCLTLFATHYFELTALPAELDGCANVHFDAVEHRDGIVFLHAVEEGPANESYGLQVARLAGVPTTVIRGARTHLARLDHFTAHRDGDLFAAAAPHAGPAPAASALRDRLAAIDPDATVAARRARDALRAEAARGRRLKACRWSPPPSAAVSDGGRARRARGRAPFPPTWPAARRGSCNRSASVGRRADGSRRRTTLPSAMSVTVYTTPA